MSTRVIKALSAEAVAGAAREGAAALEAGALVGFATETVYGVGVLATNQSALERLRELKARPQRPFSLHLGAARDVYKYVSDVRPEARHLIAKGLPGPVTLLLPTGGKLAQFEDPALYERLVWEGTLGVRCPDQPVSQAMLSAVKGPVVAPSANLAGHASPRTAQDVLADLDGRIDLLIDSGPTRYGKDSTIVDFSGGAWKIVRQGVYDERMIGKLVTWTYLFVCTGNTCRSPLAMALARTMIARRLGVGEMELASQGVFVASAGIYAGDGQLASPEAVDAAAEKGADLAGHRSRKLTMELINSSDMIFCMTDAHVEDVLAMAPQAAGKVRRLDEDGDVPDPIGGGRDCYRQTARHIEAALVKRLEEGIP